MSSSAAAGTVSAVCALRNRCSSWYEDWIGSYDSDGSYAIFFFFSLDSKMKWEEGGISSWDSRFFKNNPVFYIEFSIHNIEQSLYFFIGPHASMHCTQTRMSVICIESPMYIPIRIYSIYFNGFSEFRPPHCFWVLCRKERRRERERAKRSQERERERGGERERESGGRNNPFSPSPPCLSQSVGQSVSRSVGRSDESASRPPNLFFFWEGGRGDCRIAPRLSGQGACCIAAPRPFRPLVQRSPAPARAPVVDHRRVRRGPRAIDRSPCRTSSTGSTACSRTSACGRRTRRFSSWGSTTPARRR